MTSRSSNSSQELAGSAISASCSNPFLQIWKGGIPPVFNSKDDLSILAGIATEYVAFRPVRAKSVTAVLITSFAFSTLLQNAALLFISPRASRCPERCAASARRTAPKGPPPWRW